MKKILILSLFLAISQFSFAQKTVHLDDDTFKKLVFDYEKETEWNYKGKVPAIIDFYANWCGPCKIVAPILEDLAKEYGDKLIIYKVNTKKARNLSTAFGIKSVPSIVFIPKEGQTRIIEGAPPKEILEKAIKDILKVEK